MYQEERLYRIAELLKEKKTLSKDEIMESFDISRDTARRDILKLIEQGMAIRTYGGIAAEELNLDILSYRKRSSINQEVKKKLAKHAAHHLTKHRVCFFDESTTVVELCDYAPDELEVYTHSLDNVERLSNKNCTVRVLGGKLNRTHRFFYGTDTVSQIEQIRFDMAFIGTCAVRHDGIYIGEHEDAAIKRKVADHSNQICILVDDSKFNAAGNFRCIPLEKVDTMITNRKPPKDLMQCLDKNGVSLEIITE